MRLCFESRLYLYLLYWSVNSRKCSLWKTWGEGMFSWTYIHTGSDILSIHSTPGLDIYLCSMVSWRCCQSAWTDIVICLRNWLLNVMLITWKWYSGFLGANSGFWALILVFLPVLGFHLRKQWYITIPWELPRTTQDYAGPRTMDYPGLPRTTQDHPEPPRTTQDYPGLPRNWSDQLH